jgi:lia operon protein LiaG
MRVPILVTLAFLTPAAMTAQQAERFTVSGDEIAIYNLAGSVTIEPGSGAATVLVTRAGPGAARLSIAKGELDGRGTLRILYPSDRIVYPAMGKGSSTDLKVREDGTFSDGDFYHRHDDDEDDDRHDHYESGRRVTIVGAGDGLEASADLRIQLPAGRRAWVYLAVGKVAVANIDGELSIDAHNAPVNATGTRGALSIDVGSGPVSVTGARGTLSVDTGSGPVEVSRFEGKELTVDTGSGDVTASEVKSDGLSIDTGSGDIKLTAVSAPEITVETGSGGITADLRTNPTALSVETGSGNIRITAPQTLGAEVDIETSSGEVESDFPLQVTRHSREHLVGTIGNGRGKIQIETGSGDVRLLRKTS